MKLQKDRIPERIKKLGKGVFGTETADECIEKFTEFFSSINSPVTLDDIGLTEAQKNDFLNQMDKNGVQGLYHSLTNDDHKVLVELMN